jgi:hypothetical protein
MNHPRLPAALTLALLMLAAPLAAQDPIPTPPPEPMPGPVLKLIAPDTVNAGDLAVVKVDLEASNVKGVVFEVVPMPLLPDNWQPRENEAFLSAGAAGGTYTIVAAGVGEGGKVVQEICTIIFTGGPTPPPGPGPGPAPPPTLKALSMVWEKKVVSPTRAADAIKLAGSFESVASMIDAGAIKDQETIVSATRASNQAALGEAKTAWADPFFTPLGAELDRRNPAVTDYPGLWREIGAGLRAAEPQAQAQHAAASAAAGKRGK